MRASKPAIRCLVDDTALIRNISEIEDWVGQGAVILVVPLYTLERLRSVKKDSSQIGVNARKAVKFLDRITSGRDDLPHDPVILQGPDEQYLTWAEVEMHYLNENLKTAGVTELHASMATLDGKKQEKEAELPLKGGTAGSAGGALSQLLLDKLNFAKEPGASPASTPPLSPASSGPQSIKTSPEVRSATINMTQDQTPVPPSLKPLLNPVVWYMHEKRNDGAGDIVFLTNSADTMHLARDFGVPTKNIHQLRSALGLDAVGPKRQGKAEKAEKATSRPVSQEQKTLFSYEDEASEDEEEEVVVFKPRGRGAAKANHRASGSGSMRSKGGFPRSPRASFSNPVTPAQNKPQIPVEEIDPDSFDRGSFGRGSVPLVNTSTTPQGLYGPRSGNRGHSNGATRGGRGSVRGFERGAARGRGRLFIP